MLTEQEQFWKGDFGDQYTARNADVKWRLRIPFWRSILKKTGARSILEVGCNIGSNLKAIREADYSVGAYGCDVNATALYEARRAGLSVARESADNLMSTFRGGEFSLVATVGVLIHVAPENLGPVTDQIISVSNRYVLAVEYASETEVEVPYRGHQERLWRRPFGRLYESRSLTMVAEGAAPADAFDRCNWWLLRK
jgi:pseudaminic acid biosynthesis-associated methylase